MREYFSFKRLNKRRKVYFLIEFICSIIYLILGICSKNVLLIFFSIYVFFSALDFFSDQASDNIIESYKELLESQRVIHNNTLKMLANAIKENNLEDLKEIVDFIDERYGEDDNDDSN